MRRVLHIGVLGTVHARRDGHDVELGGPRQRAVVAMLVAAGHGRLVSVDRFVEDLWAGEPPPKALAALQAYVSRLRRALEPERRARRPAQVLTSVAPGYRLDLPVEAVDAWHLEALVDLAEQEDDAERVVDLVDRVEVLWRGDPFAAYRDHGWAIAEAGRLEELRAAAVDRRAEALLQLGRSAPAVASLAAHARAYPLRERTVELLATALYREGRQGEALEALARLRRDLVEELGVDPGPRVQALEADVLSHADHLAAPRRPPPAAPASASPAPIPPVEDDFVGREAEVARLLGCVETARTAGGPAAVWIGADAGVGKTALLERVCDEVAGSVVVARGRCPEVDGAPAAFAWSEVLAALGAEHDGTAGAFALGTSIDRALARHDGRLVLVALDDLHRADDETLQVLRHLVGSSRHPVLVVGTFRAHQVTAGLGLSFAALAERTLDRLDLGGLDPAASSRLLARFGRRTLSESASRTMVERSAGNPLFLREIGHLVSAEGAEAGLALPPVIRDLLTRRIERLPVPVVDLLSRASVLGSDVDVDLLVAVETARGGMTEEEVLDALDAGLVAGLLDLPAPADLRFTHALIHDTLYDRQPPIRRSRLHQGVLGVLERDHPERVDALAHHAAAGLDARTAPRACDHLEAATRASAAIGAYGDVVRHARAALTALDLAGPDPARRLRLLRSLADGLAATGDVAGARATRRDGIALATAEGGLLDLAEQLCWDVPTVWTVRPLAVVDRDLVALLRSTLDDLPAGHDALRVRLLSTLVLETDASDLLPVAEAAAAEALALARGQDDPRLLCQALNAAYFVSFMPRPGDRMRAVGHEMLGTARASGLVTYEAVAHHVLFGAAAGDGDLGTAAVHVAEAVRCATVGQLPLLIVVGAMFGAAARLVQGDVDGAAAAYDDLTRRLTASGDANGEAMGDVLAFCVAHARGDTAEALDRLTPYLDRAEMKARDLVVRCLLDAGDVDRARATWRPDEPVFEDYLWGFFTAVRAENAAELGDVEVARDAYDRLLPWAGRFAGLASGSTSLQPIDDVLGRLAVALDRPGEARRHFDDAAALSRRYGNETWVRRSEDAARVLVQP